MADEEHRDTAPDEEPAAAQPEAGEADAAPEPAAAGAGPEETGLDEGDEADAASDGPEAPEGDASAAEDVSADDAGAAEGPASAADAPAASERGGPGPVTDEPEAPTPAGQRPRGGPAGGPDERQEEVVPGADLEPDLVLEEQPDEEQVYAEAAEAYPAPPEEAEAVQQPEPAAAPEEAEPRPTPLTPRKLAADARYQATGKRKTSVARVILRPGKGGYTVNGRTLEDFFPRPTLQKTARQPLTAAGYDSRMDVVAKLHGGGVSSQAGALRHGVARALVEADPNLRGEMKRRGFLTRDARVKERKKAGLKKARKRPQFSKR